MSEGKWLLRPLGTRDDYSHLLRLLHDAEKFVNVDQADRSQKLKAETAPDHCGCSQHPLFVLVEPFQTAADDQPHVLWNVALVDLDVSAEFAGRIKDLAVFRQMPINFFNEERIALTFLEDQAHQAFRS